MNQLQRAAEALIQSVVERHNLNGPQDLECPYFRALAEALRHSYDDGK
jgi:hypothetical protein